jgi:two-component system chemotaxis response regulator CheB
MTRPGSIGDGRLDELACVCELHRTRFMSRSRIVVIGASAGGIEALQHLASQLHPDFPAPICVVLHTSPDSRGLLPSILNRSGRLPAEHARDGVKIHTGRLYIARQPIFI